MISTAIESNPLQSAEAAIRQALAATDGQVVESLLQRFDELDHLGRRALFIALAGRVLIAHRRSQL